MALPPGPPATYTVRTVRTVHTVPPRPRRHFPWFLAAVIGVLILVLIGQFTSRSSQGGYKYPHAASQPLPVLNLNSGPNALVVACLSYYPYGHPAMVKKCHRHGSIDGKISVVRHGKVTIITARPDMEVNFDFLPADPTKSSPHDMPKATMYSWGWARLQLFYDKNGDVDDSSPCPGVPPNGTTIHGTSLPVFCLKTNHELRFTVRLVCNGPIPGTPCQHAGQWLPHSSWRVDLRVRYPRHPH
jgi:hypothetical protein